MNNVWFKPFVGSNYGKGGFHGKKILVVGNSHYCKDYRNITCFRCGVDGCHFDGEDAEGTGGCYTYTQDEVLFDKPTAYWNFARAIKNQNVSEAEYDEVWKDFAFYNYLQTAVTNDKDPGKDEHYHLSEPAFWDVLEELHPDGLVIWGKRVKDIKPKFNNDTGDGYVLSDGSNVSVLEIHHPCQGFSWEGCHTEIMNWINSF